MRDTDNMLCECPIEALASILGKKWVPNIIWILQEEKIRFNELERRVKDCSRKMLIQQLELLINENIILNDKNMYGNIMESVYYLSESGRTLLPIIKGMILWSNKNLNCKKYYSSKEMEKKNE